MGNAVIPHHGAHFREGSSLTKKIMTSLNLSVDRVTSEQHPDHPKGKEVKLPEEEDPKLTSMRDSRVEHLWRWIGHDVHAV